MNDKNHFDRYYCIQDVNSAKTKEITVHYISQPHHVLYLAASLHSHKTIIEDMEWSSFIRVN